MSTRGSLPGVSRLALVTVAVLLWNGARVEPIRAAGGASPEYQMKAAFIASFPRFVEWPAERLPAEGAPFVVAILGLDPFGPYLREAVSGKQVAGHPIEVRSVPGPRGATLAHVVFISESERARLPLIVRELQESAILTVGDSDGFATAGVMVNLFVEQRRVRFEINQPAASRAGLRLSAQLLSLARLVGGGA